MLSKTCDLEVPFEKLDFTVLREVESKLLERGLKPNSISVYLRALRAIYNVAINKKVVDYSHYPFRSFRICKEKTIPSVLSVDELRRYFALDLGTDHPHYEAWLLGKLSFLLGGINFIDLVLLTRDNIKMGRVIYRRSKTKKLYSIVILEQTQKILDYFIRKHAITLCNALGGEELESGIKLPYIIRDKNKQFNKRLEQLGQMIGAKVKLRSYTFRYSIANLCKQLGYDISLISELLGHSYGSAVTMGYLEAFHMDRLDEMLRDVCDAVVIQEEKLVTEIQNFN